jgi:histidinol-phosphate aminotransferase
MRFKFGELPSLNPKFEGNYMSRFLSKKYEALVPYTPGEQPKIQGLIKLNTNESPFSPSPKVTQALNAEEIDKLNLYPDPEATVLVKALSKHYNIPESRIAVGNGSDELLAFSFMAFQNESRVICFPDISYGFYKVYAEIYGANPRLIKLNDNLEIDPKDYADAPGTIVIANPNPPTGTALTIAEIESLLNANKNNLVIIDEAYVSFGAQTSVPLIEIHDNLLVIQTFSKDRNLAGARIGMAFGQEDIIEDLNKMKYSFNPYNLNRLSILAGTAAVEDNRYFEDCVEKIKKTRQEFIKDMTALGFQVIPSFANFVFAKHDKITGAEYYKELRDKNILVRHFENQRIKDYVRITIGTKEQMDALINATKQII